MELGKAVEILRERVRIDRGMREQEDTPFEELGDYDRFCELNNLAIERVLDEISYEARKGTEDCIMCICLECYNKNKIEPEKCQYSDCEECFSKLGEYTENCNEFKRLK